MRKARNMHDFKITAILVEREETCPLVVVVIGVIEWAAEGGLLLKLTTVTTHADTCISAERGLCQ